MGAKRLKFFFDLAPRLQAIAQILKEHGLSARRQKKHRRKKDLREIKKRWKLFGQVTVDTKDLNDIPHYWPQMKALGLPRYQFTAREVRSGLMFLGYARENSASNACLFGTILCEHFRACGLDLKGLRFQSDNGHEFIGGRPCGVHYAGKVGWILLQPGLTKRRYAQERASVGFGNGLIVHGLRSPGPVSRLAFDASEHQLQRHRVPVRKDTCHTSHQPYQ